MLYNANMGTKQFAIDEYIDNFDTLFEHLRHEKFKRQKSQKVFFFYKTSNRYY